jgi:hypothetical protein
MAVLVYLAKHSGEVLSKERIIQAEWTETFVTDQVLTNAIFELRKAFKDDSKDPRFIQTVARRGYLLMVPVSREEGLAEEKSSRAVPLRWIVVTVVGVAIVIGTWLWLDRLKRRDVVVQLKPVPLTSYVGKEACPSFSPDGNQVVFQWNGESQDNVDIYIKQVNGEGRLRLTTDPAVDSSPVWSPDGRYIAFVRIQRKTSKLFLVPPLKGEERQIASASSSSASVPRSSLRSTLTTRFSRRFLMT